MFGGSCSLKGMFGAAESAICIYREGPNERSATVMGGIIESGLLKAQADMYYFGKVGFFFQKYVPSIEY